MRTRIFKFRCFKVQGHIASPARLLSVSRRLRHILGFSAATQVSPSLQHYTSDSISELPSSWNPDYRYRFSVADFFDQRHDVRVFPADAKLLWQLPS